MNRVLPIVLAIAGLLSLAWLTREAIVAGSANALVYGASKEMGTWIAARTQPADATRASVRGVLEQAASLDPRDPAVHELLGLLEAVDVEGQRQAVAHFTRALELRPTAPYTWANLARSRYLSGDTGAGFELALVRAAQFGPSEREVQRTVADFGLAMHAKVAPATRSAIDSMVVAGFKRNPLEMLQIADRRGRLDLVCRRLAAEPRTPDRKWSKLCQSTEATS